MNARYIHKLLGIIFLGQIVVFAQLTPTLSNVYTFKQQLTDAAKPNSITHGARGVLYGTAEGGPGPNGGAIFRLTPPPPGKTQWSEQVIYSSFPLQQFPQGKLVLDAAGSLYGTTNTNGGSAECGGVFRLDPPVVAGGIWTETTLYAFQCSPDLAFPFTGVVFDSFGNLYGSTARGGPADLGGIFKLAPPAVAGGPWTESVLYAFADLSDGWAPNGPPVFDTQGNLYATTAQGGAFGYGEAFMLTPSQPGTAWNKTDIFDFQGHSTGLFPSTPLLIDSTGTLYGGTRQAKSGLGGGLFQLTPPAMAGQPWTEVLIHSFHGPDGGPMQTLAFDSKGNIVGATQVGGNYDNLDCQGGCGVVFKANRPTSPGQPWLPGWTMKLPPKPDPEGSTIMDIDLAPNGTVYGVTFLGGTFGEGAVFQIQP